MIEITNDVHANKQKMIRPVPSSFSKTIRQSPKQSPGSASLRDKLKCKSMRDKMAFFKYLPDFELLKQYICLPFYCVSPLSWFSHILKYKILSLYSSCSGLHEWASYPVISPLQYNLISHMKNMPLNSHKKGKKMPSSLIPVLSVSPV